MSAMPGSAQSELYAGLLPVEPSDEPPPIRATVLENDPLLHGQPSLRKRASRALSRFLITFCLGIAATLAWQSYGDACRKIIVESYPQLGWLAPQVKPADTIALASPPASSFDQQQLNAMFKDLEAVRQSIDGIATSITAGQEQMTRNIDRIATTISSSQEQMTQNIDRIATSISSGQEQMMRNIDRIATTIAGSQEQMMHSIDQLTAGQERAALEITKLQAVEQFILYKNSEPPPRTDPAPTPKRVPWPSQASTAR